MNVKEMFLNIQNFTLEECISIFGSNEIYLPHYELMAVGKIQGQIKIGFLKILEYPQPPHGNYKIGVFHANNMTTYIEMYVPSLTYIRENIFQYEDQLSFERSTFVIVSQKQVLVRLKCVRCILVTNHFSNNILNIKTLTKRTQSQFVKCMQQIYTSYVRDLQDSYKKEEILCMLEKDVHEYLKKFNQLIV
jgi:hypothetical protein